MIDREFEYQIGQRIRSKYEIEHVLGGGMGIVFVVRDVSSGDIGAVKTFPNSVLESGHRRQDLQLSPVTARFVTEALVWMSLGVHPNIVTAERVETIDGRPFIFLEYVRGGDLSGAIQTGQLAGNLPRVLGLAINFCDGMIHARLNGLEVHRDIKPQNCLLSDHDVLKVSDFGLAKALDNRERTDRDSRAFVEAYLTRRKPQATPSPIQAPETGGNALTRTGQRMGTAPYMAPEQFDDPKRVDVRADVYSFGVMLVEMLTGRRPFRAGSWDEYARLHETARPPRVPGAPELLRELVGSCLAKEPDKRPASFSEIRNALDETLRSIGKATIPEPPAADVRPALTLARRASSLAALGRIPEALAAADRAVQLEPESGFTWGIRGEVLLDAQHPGDAAASLRTATHRQPDDYRWWFGRGKAARASGDFAKALQHFDKALGLNRADGTLWADRAELLINRGDNEEAFKSFHRALELDPYSAETYLKRGVALSRLGRSDEAHISFVRACEVNPRSAIAWDRRGTSALDSGNGIEALECFRRVFNLLGSTPVNALRMGMAYETSGELDYAVGGYELAVREDPNFAEAWARLGALQLRLRQVREARHSLTRACNLKPDMALAWLHLGHLESSAGQHKDAFDAFRRAETLGDPDALAWSAVALARLGQDDDARTSAKAYLHAQETGLGRYALGEAELASGHAAAALAEFRRAESLGFALPDDAVARCQGRLRFS